MATKTRSTLTPYQGTASEIPADLEGLPPELEAPAEAVRAAVVSMREAQEARGRAYHAATVAGVVTVEAARARLPRDHVPHPDAPELERAFRQAELDHKAAEAHHRQACAAQDDAIAQVLDRWQQEQQVLLDEAQADVLQHLDEFDRAWDTFENRVVLTRALRAFQAANPRSRMKWGLDLRDPGRLARDRARELRRLIEYTDLGVVHIEPTASGLVAALRVLIARAVGGGQR